MKRRVRFFIPFLVIVAIAVVGIMYISSKNTTFKEMVLDKLNSSEISSIEIIKSDRINEKEVTVTDASEISNILGAFSQMKLKESRISNIDFTTSYWITIRSNGSRNFGITLYDTDYIVIYDYNAAALKNNLKSYEITNDLDPMVIADLTNSD